MARILIHVEGQTEETFVSEVLSPHLLGFGHDARARILGNPRQTHRGGICSWSTAGREIVRHLLSDPNIFVTTMVDYYGLPGTWPRRTEASGLPFAQKSQTVQQAMQTDIAGLLGKGAYPKRFIPYVMMHEFEAMLFSDCALFARGIGQPKLASDFRAIRDQFSTPEEINDSAMTAPSKRIKALVPGYEKPVYGAIAALEIGIDAIRKQCPFFQAWLTTLESLP